jgi:hypothetical protein
MIGRITCRLRASGAGDSKRYTVRMNNGDPITTWADATGTYPAAEATLSPVYFNGGVRFEGNDQLQSNCPLGGPAMTAFVVCRVADLAGERTLFAPQVGSGLQLRLDGGTGKPHLIKASAASIGIGTTGVTPGALTTLSVTYNAATGAWAHFLNGTPNGSGTNQQTLAASKLRMGRHGSGGETFKGEIYAMVFYSAVLSAADRVSVENYLKARYV